MSEQIDQAAILRIFPDEPLPGERIDQAAIIRYMAVDENGNEI